MARLSIVVRRPWGRLAGVVGGAFTLAACATVEPDAPIAQAPASPPSPPRMAHQDRSPPPPVMNGKGGTNRPYQVNGVWYTPREERDYDRVGTASWYGPTFHGRSTADGEVFDMNAVTGAHTTLPLPSIVEVTNLDNGKKIRVRLNDRGPFIGDRIIDVSREAARQLGFDRQGLAHVRVRYIGPAETLFGTDVGLRYASARTTAPAPLARARSTPAKATPAPITDEIELASAPAALPVRSMVIQASMPIATAPATPAAVVPTYRIQAAAFSDQANAQRAAAQLARVARARVEIGQRNGATLWRVMLDGPADQLQAYNLRHKVAEAGFADARVIGPF